MNWSEKDLDLLETSKKKVVRPALADFWMSLRETLATWVNKASKKMKARVEISKAKREAEKATLPERLETAKQQKLEDLRTNAQIKADLKNAKLERKKLVAENKKTIAQLKTQASQDKKLASALKRAQKAKQTLDEAQGKNSNWSVWVVDSEDKKSNSDYSPDSDKSDEKQTHNDKSKNDKSKNPENWPTVLPVMSNNPQQSENSKKESEDEKSNWKKDETQDWQEQNKSQEWKNDAENDPTILPIVAWNTQDPESQEWKDSWEDSWEEEDKHQSEKQTDENETPETTTSQQDDSQQQSKPQETQIATKDDWDKKSDDKIDWKDVAVWAGSVVAWTTIFSKLKNWRQNIKLRKSQKNLKDNSADEWWEAELSQDKWESPKDKKTKSWENASQSQQPSQKPKKSLVWALFPNAKLVKPVFKKPDFKKYWNETKSNLKQDKNSFKNFFSNWLKKAKDWKNTTTSSLKSDMSFWKNFLSSFFPKLVAEINYTKNSFKSDMKSLWEFATKTSNNLKTWTKNTFSSAINDTQKAWKFATSIPKKTLDNYFGIFWSLYDWVEKLVKRTTGSKAT